MEAHGHPVLVVPGEAANIKITHPEDLALLEERSPRHAGAARGHGL